ncbi:MAG: peptidoglycan DD-metalloendopeptidase family protein [Candidatus Promineofilum sp.]|nr:peptidoglycan DD-metalloendopeptidase family protein [Promineifilum sp.]
MKTVTRYLRQVAAVALVASVLAACTPARIETPPHATSVLSPTSRPPSRPPAVATTLSTAIATMPPTAVATKPAALPTRTAEPTPRPSATTDLSGVALPCPATPPTKPDYPRYVLAADPWPTPDPAAPSPLSLADPLPTAGRNTGYPYGSDGSGRYLLHNGLDMADEDESLASAAADGTVIVARDDVDEMFGWRCDWYGALVVIRLDELWAGQPVYTLYGHIQDVQVSEGQHVQRGDPVARQGTAGVAVVAHLHLEVRVGENTFGATQNPLLWVEPPAGRGVIAGRLIDPDGRAWQGITVTLIDRSGTADFVNTWTYLDDPQHLIRPGAAYAENFVFGPVAAGSYDVYTKIQGVEYRQPVEVLDGQVSAVGIVTEPFHTPTPEP